VADTRTSLVLATRDFNARTYQVSPPTKKLTHPVASHANRMNEASRDVGSRRRHWLDVHLVERARSPSSRSSPQRSRTLKSQSSSSSISTTSLSSQPPITPAPIFGSARVEGGLAQDERRLAGGDVADDHGTMQKLPSARIQVRTYYRNLLTPMSERHAPFAAWVDDRRAGRMCVSHGSSANNSDGHNDCGTSAAAAESVGVGPSGGHGYCGFRRDASGAAGVFNSGPGGGGGAPGRNYGFQRQTNYPFRAQPTQQGDGRMESAVASSGTSADGAAGASGGTVLVSVSPRFARRVPVDSLALPLRALSQYGPAARMSYFMPPAGCPLLGDVSRMDIYRESGSEMTYIIGDDGSIRPQGGDIL
jgi:hypothetical protein